MGEQNSLESQFKRKIKKKIKELFPDCIILPGDAESIQGIPDMIILFNKVWAALEFKRSESASHRPNQEYYINKMDNMSFASFICPENKDSVLQKLEAFFNSHKIQRL